MKKNSAEKILERIDRRIAKLAKRASDRGEKFPKSDRAISKAATGSPETLRGIRRNVANGVQSGVSLTNISKFARFLKTTDAWLLNETGPEELDDLNHDSDPFERTHYAEVIEAERKAVIGTVPLVGYVGAGAAAHFYEGIAQENLDRVPAPFDATESSVAVEIRGTSLGTMFDRWLVYYDDVRRPVTHDLVGKLCVVGTDDGRILVKKLLRSKTQPGTFDLISEVEPPILGVSVQWAAKVRQLAPQ